MKFIKWFVIILLALALSFETYLFATGKLFVNKVLSMTILNGKLNPDIFELNDFPSRVIPSAAPQPWPKATRYGTVHPADSLLVQSAKFKTTALLIIQHDSLVFEDYQEGTNAHTLTNSFSMAKTFTSILIGVALKEGKIKSLDEPIGNYIAAYNQAPYNTITIRHLLWMSSGLAFNESYGSPFSWPAEAYYGEDVNATVMHIPAAEAPGKTFAYKGGDTQLLGIILQKATGVPVAQYAAEKLWTKIGAEDTAFWSLDHTNGMEKVSCCYYATAADFARIAKLYMQQGNWNGEQIVDSAFVAASITPGEPKLKSGEANHEYGYQWWIGDYKNHHFFFARGIRGQYIFAIPDLDMILVRLGHQRGSKQHPDDLPSDVFTYLNMAFELGAEPITASVH